MKLRCGCAYVACLVLMLPATPGSQRPANAIRQERERAAREVPQLAELLVLKPGMIVAAVAQDALSNVVVLEGAESSTNLPSECCDAIFLRDVYHHLTRPHDFDVSLLAALKPGGRLAIIDFPPEQGSSLPAGVPDDRGGHGIPTSIVVAEVTRAGFGMSGQCCAGRQTTTGTCCSG